MPRHNAEHSAICSVPQEATHDDEAPLKVAIVPVSAKRQRTRRRSPIRTLFTAVRVRLLQWATVWRNASVLWLQSHRQQLTTWTTSFLIHAMVALLLSLWMLRPEIPPDWITLLLAQTDPHDVEPAPVHVIELIQPETLEDRQVDSTLKEMMSHLQEGLATRKLESPLEQDFQVSFDVLDATLEIPMHLGDLGGRSASAKQIAVRRYGGTADSEQAVNRGLKWLTTIQRNDGSWNFAEVGPAGDPGNLNTTDMGATALSLLCFLGAGHTHQTEGPYQDVVTSGLSYLFRHADRGSYGADLRGQAQANSSMYVQGIASICICEASAMHPEDRELRKLAIESISFIERAQDPSGGGWRYFPRDAGDTSVVGWQVMALHSAKAGKIRVDNGTFRDVRRFLHSVSVDDGAAYAYMPDQRTARPAMTAVGLLCRMYLGWKRDHPGLRRGVEQLSARGPSREDLYYNYYAAQVMHHFGGEHWDRWNAELRPWLVETQIKDGPGEGSWNVTDPHGAAAGGRIYQTALSLLTLEVYYRHLPIYRKLDHAAQHTADDARDE